MRLMRAQTEEVRGGSEVGTSEVNDDEAKLRFVHIVVLLELLECVHHALCKVDTCGA